jgi:RNA polymerase sigma-70 factor, ECF subfamily
LRISSMSEEKSRFDVTGQLAALRRYGLSLTRNAAEAEDLVHEALLRAYEKRATFRKDRNLRAWLLSIVHNCFVDGARKKRSEAIKLLRAGELASDYVPAPQEHAVRLAQVRQSFMALPDEQRAALHLVAIEGLAYQEAATTLGIPIGTLMSRLGRARAALRAIEDGSAVSTQAGEAPTARHLKIVGGSDDTVR